MTEKTIAVLNVRMPEDLKWWIAVAAVGNRRSVNSEIIYQLEAIYAPKAPAEGSAA
jgi:hypothetical protein